MPKIDRAHKSYTRNLRETHFREIFYGTLIFSLCTDVTAPSEKNREKRRLYSGYDFLAKYSMICSGRHVGGHTLALQHGSQNYFFLYLVKYLLVTLRCAVNVTTSSFQHFP